MPLTNSSRILDVASDYLRQWGEPPLGDDFENDKIMMILRDLLPEDEEGLVQVAVEEGSITAKYYRITDAIVALTAVIASAQAGWMAAVITLVGLWQLKQFKEPLTPTAALILYYLTTQPDLRARVDDIPDAVMKLAADWKVPMVEKLEALTSIELLTHLGILRRVGPEALLVEQHTVCYSGS